MTSKEKEEQKDLGQSLVASLQSDDVISIASDAAELALDTGLAEGLIRDIPLVGNLVSMTKLGLTVRDTFFVRKLLRFLRQLKEISSEERQVLIQKLEADTAYGRKAGEHLMEILERIDSHRKPEMTARVFGAFVSGKIDIALLHRLNNAIEKVPFYEIDSIRKIDESMKQGKVWATDEAFQALENAGLMTPVSAVGGLAYQSNDLCRVFLQLELDKVGDARGGA